MNSPCSPHRPGIEILESRIAPAVLIVSNLNDNGPGSLRNAITTANGASGDRIIFRAGLHGTVTLESTLPTITAPMSIAGPGANLIKIDGAEAHRIFDINNGSSTVDAPVAISGLSILDGSASGAGGGIFSRESLTLARVIVSGNTSTGDGGGVYVNLATSDASVKIGGSVISGNTAGLFGGGVFEYGAHSMSIVTSTVSGNSAGTGSTGGGVYAEVNATSTGLSISRSKFTGNQAKYGGGLLLNNANSAATSNITLSGLIITGNKALNGPGGGLEFGNSSIADGTVNIIGGVISGNMSEAGGGIFSRHISALTISGGIIDENASTGTENSGINSGGGLFVEEGGGVKVTGAQILHNTSATGGGGISVANGTSLTVIGCIVTGNKANAGDGGGVCAIDPGVGESASIKGGLFSGNTSAGQGGGLYFDGQGSSVTIAGARVDGNTSESFGGGGVKIGVTGTVTVEDSSFIKNVSNESGGGLNIRNSADLIMTGSVLRDNSGKYGGGLYMENDTGSVLKTTISGNKAMMKGGGVYITGSNITLQKGLVTGNTAPTGKNIYGTYTAS
jgi:predicted outer membrane repeat protein